ncbi:MAG: hypothetical protein MjAS7_1313 [Metallosphaera javensis (ex Sakai et al. 2022)]|nr:MAG: hypothetical protein MjAS7_1313 [Metallosphaera javensis (ex Sakai et al. 2022)]
MFRQKMLGRYYSPFISLGVKEEEDPIREVGMDSPKKCFK